MIFEDYHDLDYQF